MVPGLADNPAHSFGFSIHQRNRSSKTETTDELDDFSRRYSQDRNTTEYYFKLFDEDIGEMQ